MFIGVNRVLLLVFSQRKSFRFNRFYLIFALLFSYIIPLITLKLPAKEEVKTDLVFQNLPSEAIVLSGKPVEADVNWALIIFSFYGLITFFLLAKSIFSIVKILRLKGDFIKVNNLKTKILEESISPFSFLGTLYIGKNYFKNNSIDERIFSTKKITSSKDTV